MMTGVAVIGAGHWGPHLIRNFHDHRAGEVLWVVDADGDRLRAVGERFRGVQLSTGPEAAFQDPRVDAVVVATPTTTHFELVGAALRAGKHVLVEKPIAASVDAATALARLAADTGRVLMVGHVFLFNPAIQAAARYITDGELGPIHYLSMTRTNLGPVRVDVNAAWDLAAHDISIANFWLGAEPVGASAVGGSWVNPGIEDAVFATLRYPENVIVHIEASWLSPRKSRLIEVVGERKMLTVDDMDLSEPLRIYDKGVLGAGPGSEIADTFAGFRAQIREGTIISPRVTLGEPLRNECEEFIARVRGESVETLSDGWTGVRVVEVLEAIDVSAKEGGHEVLLQDLRP